MLRIFLSVSLIFILHSCKHDDNCASKQIKDNKSNRIGGPANKEFRLTTRYILFDTTVSVLFKDTQDPINDIQRENYNGFVSKQEALTPEILDKIFEFYKSSYPDYKLGWKMGGVEGEELEEFLPTPTTPEDLKRFITPINVYIQSGHECEAGTLGLEFDCTWDIEHGLGVLIKEWKVKEAGLADVTYF